MLKNGEQFADALVRADVPRQHRRRRLHRPRPAALLRHQSREEGRAVEDRARELRQRRRAGRPSRSPPARSRSTRRDGSRRRRRRSGRAGTTARRPGTDACADAAPAQTGPKEGGKGDAPLPPTKPIAWAPGKAKVLVIGGGSSHNFGSSSAAPTSRRSRPPASASTTPRTATRRPRSSRNADVAVISVNRQFFDTPEYRKALFDFAAAGKGLVMLHPGTWYGYANWPELNAHDRRRRRRAATTASRSSRSTP